jgi:hypothetical protein
MREQAARLLDALGLRFLRPIHPVCQEDARLARKSTAIDMLALRVDADLNGGRRNSRRHADLKIRNREPKP